MKPGWQWPVIVIGLLVAGVLSNLIFLVIASQNTSFAVEEDYYQKALDWDELQRQKQRNADLGWQLALSFAKTDPLGIETEVSVELTDRDGAPIEGAEVTLKALAIARADEILEASLAPVGAGRYTAPLRIRRAGRWEYRFVVRRGDELYTETIEREMLGR